MLASVNLTVQIFQPVAGDLADKMPPRFSKYFGRRRPFVLFGHLTYALGLFFSYHGLYGRSEHLMVFGQLLSGFSGMIQGPNYAALNAETIPASQRGTMGSIQNTVGTISGLGANGLGVLIGEGWVDKHLGGDKTIWRAILVWKICMVPLMMMQFNSRAGCWYPEVPRPEPPSVNSEDYRKDMEARAQERPEDYRTGSGQRTFVVKNERSRWMRYTNPIKSSTNDYRKGGAARYFYCNEEAGVCTFEAPPEGIVGDASPTFSDFAARFSATNLQTSSKSLLDRVWARVREFFSAFEEPAFLWWWICLFAFVTGGQFFGFFFYWLQDCFPNGYTVFGYTITHSAQSMVSILGAPPAVTDPTMRSTQETPHAPSFDTSCQRHVFAASLTPRL